MKHLFFIAVLLSAFVFRVSAEPGSHNLNAGWKFHLGDFKTPPVGLSYDDSKWEAVAVPHTLRQAHRWLLDEVDDIGKYMKKDGVVAKAPVDKLQVKYHRLVGWYRKTFVVPANMKGKRFHIVFDGIMQTAKVWINGHYLGENAIGGYTPFDFDVTKLVKPGDKNILTVRVDHTVNQHAPPDPDTKDYMQFGGFYRDVHFVVTGNMRVTFPWDASKAGTRVVVPSATSKSAVVKVTTVVRNDGSNAGKCELVSALLDARGKVVAEAKYSADIAPGKDRVFEREFKPIGNPRLWSPESPYLYTLSTKVFENGKLSDVKTENVGLRMVDFSKKTGFSLNGKKYFIDGHCRHQFYPFVGDAVVDRYQWFDAWMLRQAGNGARTCHYPQSPAYLDACDYFGLLVLEEPPTWMKKGDEQWYKNLAEALKRMIRRDRNHPSIVTWSICINHGRQPFKNDAAGVDAAKITIVEDTTRKCAARDYSLPMCYGKRLLKNGALASEYPNWGGRWYRWDDDSMLDETRQWLAKISAMRSEPSAAGAYSWLMFDYNTPRNAYYQKTICPNGIVDQYRIPKYAYYAYRARFSNKPMVFIADRWLEKERGERKFVEVYSNCDKVELSLNGKKLGAMTKMTDYPVLPRPPFRMDVPYSAGTLKATGFINGKAVVEHTVRTPGKPVALRLATDYNTIYAGGGTDWTRVVVSLVDANGTVVNETVKGPRGKPFPSRRMVEFSVSGPGGIYGDNPTVLEAGKMVVFVHSGAKPGAVVLSAKSAGMKPATLKVGTVPFPKKPNYIPDNDLAKVWKVLDPSVVVKRTKAVAAASPVKAASAGSDSGNYGKPCVVVAKPPSNPKLLKEHKRCGMVMKDGKAVYVGRLEKCDGADSGNKIAVGIPVKGISYASVHETVLIDKKNVISIKFTGKKK